MVNRKKTSYQTFNGNATLGNRVTCQISRNGDLVHKLYLVMMTSSWDGTKDARDDIEKVEIEIGGQLIDRQYGHWMKIWNELTLPAGISGVRPDSTWLVYKDL